MILPRSMLRRTPIFGILYIIPDMPVIKEILSLKTIEIPPHGIHLIVKIKINNRIANLVLDTGASQTVLDSNRIDRFMKERNFKKNDGHTSGIGAHKLQSHIVPVKKFQMGAIVLKDIELVLLDLVNVNSSYAMINEKPVDGVLGGDILNQLSAIINYSKKEMTFFYKSSSKKIS